MEQSSSALKRLISGFLSLTGGEIISRLLGFFTSLYLARTLGTAGFGQFSVALVVVSYGLLAVGPGFDVPGARAIAERPASAHMVLACVLRTRVPVALLAYLLIVVLVTTTAGTALTILVEIQGLAVVIGAWSLQFVFQGLERFGAISRNRMLGAALTTLLTLILVHTSADVRWAAGSSSAAAALAVGALWPVLKSAGLEKEQGGAILHPGEIFTAWAPITVSYLMIQIYYNSDTIFLQWFRTSEEVGIYSAAYRPILLLMAIPGLAASALLPALAGEKNSERRSRFVQTSARLLTWLGIGLCGAGFLSSDTLLSWLFGPAYEPGGPAMKVLFVAAGLAFVNVAVANPLLAWGKHRQYLLVVTCAAAANLAGNLLWIPKRGMTGAAAATVLAELFVLLIAVRIQRRDNGIRLARVLFVPVTAGLGTFALASFAGQLAGSAGVVQAVVFLLLMSVVVLFFEKGQDFHMF